MFRDPRFVLVLAIAVGLWVPLTHVDWFQEFDLGAYLVRTVEWAEELRSGQLYPRWAPDLYGGYGEPLFVFFAPAIYSVTGLLTATFLEPVTSLKLVALGGSLLAGAGTYALVHGLTRQADAALLGAVSYLAAPYRLGDLYERGDFAEFCCIGLLPVVIALYLAAAGEARPFRARALAAGAALTHAAMILTHTILGLWGSLFVGLIVLVRCVQLYRAGAKQRVLPLLVALACAPGLAGAYVLPAMGNREHTHTQALIAGFYRPQNHWITLSDLFSDRSYLFARNFNRVGPLIAVAALVTVAGAALGFKRARPALGWLALSLALVALTLPTGYAVWQPGRLPLVEFIQFPWRLLGPATLFASVALGMGMAAATERRLSPRARTSLAIAGSAALLFVFAWPYAYGKPVPNDFPRAPEAIRQGIHSTTSADEFLPKEVAARPTSPRRDLVTTSDGAHVAASWSDGSRHSLSLTAERAGAVVSLAQYAFPGWALHTRSGPARATIEADEQGLLRLRLPSPGSYRLDVAYEQPRLAWLGFGLSALALLILGLSLLRGSSYWPPRVPTDGAA